MNSFYTNIVTHFPSQTQGVLFKNLADSGDPNIYVLFSGHVCSTDTINTTFLTYNNLTVNAKILNTNIWTDVACAVIQTPSQITFPIITQITSNPVFSVNQSVTYFSNYQINNSAVLPITSEVRVPNYMYPQQIYNFFYPDSILLKESQGVVGVSGSPVIDSNNNIVALVSKIVGQNDENNLVATKTSMIYNYLFDEFRGLVLQFYRAYLINPNIINNLSLLVAFRNSYNITLCHLGFLFRSYKDLTSKAKNNLSPAVNGIILKYRITGLNDNNYNLVDYLQKNDEEITYFRTLFDNTDILSDFYKNKSFVVLKNITFIDRSNNSVTLDLGTQSIANYYVNGDPSKTVTIQYYVYGLSGQGGINMTFGPLKTLSVSPIEVKDGEEGTRYTSQLPRLLTSTSSRVNNIIQINLYNLNINLMAYRFKYCALTINEEVVSGVAGVALLSGYTYYRANMNRVAAENRFLSGKEGNEYETAKEIIKNMRQFLSDRSTPEVKLTNLQNISLSANKAGLSKSNEINRAFNDNKLTTAEDLSKAYNDVLDSVRNGLTNTAGLSEQFKQSLANYIDEAKGGFTDFVNSSGQITRLSQLANDADEEVSDYLGHLDI